MAATMPQKFNIPHMKWLWNRTMLNFCGIVAAILKVVTGRNLSMSGINSGHHYHNAAQIPHCSISTSWIDSRHRKISTGLHFKNGCHNAAKIQHCSISKVIRDIIIYPHIKFWWYRTMLNFYRPFLYRVLAAILKMADISKILKTQNCSSNGDLSLWQILCLYHYS
jgi:hypothetical protein